MIVHVEMDDVLADMPHRLNLEDAQTVADVWTRLAALPNVRRSSARPAW